MHWKSSAYHTVVKYVVTPTTMTSCLLVLGLFLSFHLKLWISWFWEALGEIPYLCFQLCTVVFLCCANFQHLCGVSQDFEPAQNPSILGRQIWTHGVHAESNSQVWLQTSCKFGSCFLPDRNWSIPGVDTKSFQIRSPSLSRQGLWMPTEQSLLLLWCTWAARLFRCLDCSEIHESWPVIWQKSTWLPRLSTRR